MIDKVKRENQFWYMRRGEHIEGPFPAGLISRYIIIGRIKMTDEVSTDRLNWMQASEIDGIMPSVLHGDLNDAYNKQRLMAAKRWEDERALRDRRGGAHLLLGNDRRGFDQREYEEKKWILENKLTQDSLQK